MTDRLMTDDIVDRPYLAPFYRWIATINAWLSAATVCWFFW